MVLQPDGGLEAGAAEGGAQDGGRSDASSETGLDSGNDASTTSDGSTPTGDAAGQQDSGSTQDATPGGPDATTDNAPTFTALYDQVISSGCSLLYCHNSAAGHELDMSSRQLAYQHLVNVD